MKKQKLYLFLLLFTSCYGLAAKNVKLVNTGAMNVKGSMYIDGDMQMKDHSSAQQSVVLIHNGTTALSGSFYHDASGNIFKTENDAWTDRTIPRGITTSTGTFRFSKDSSGKKRYITSSDTTNFDRVVDYIAFPKLDINTNDSIYIPSTLGLDACIISRANDKNGILYLASNIIGSTIYDASLRITGHEGSYSVEPGAIVLEKRIKEFRETSGGSASTILMPFAAPFTNMRSGYFAGNWVRRPLLDNTMNSFYYPYANEDADGDDTIDKNQYIINPYEDLVASQAYLIRLQKAGGTLDDAYAGLGITSGENTHDKDKLIINGTPFTILGGRSEGKQLFAGDPVLSRTVQSGKSKTQNWVIGNSYTSALNGHGIAEYLMNSVASYFVTDMYIYHHGATAYETYSMWNGSNIPSNIPDIHSMGIFMIAASANNNATENITIGPEYQIHTGGISGSAVTVSNPLIKSRKTSENELTFVLTPVDNSFVFDRSTIVLSEKAEPGADSYDISKLLNPSNRLFQLYGNNNSNMALQQNALPYSAEKAFLSVSPAAEEMQCVLTVQNTGSFEKEFLELYDTKLKHWHDLKLDNTYSFVLSPGDNAERFEVHFTPRTTTGLETNERWYIYNTESILVAKNLDNSHEGKMVRIYNTAGILMLQSTISDSSEYRIDISNLPAGVYTFTLEEKTVKFLKRRS